MLRHLPPVTDPRVLVGASTRDDAAVYRLTDELAVVTTVDYITPVVDDPHAWGRVAAANALSDIYAMGAEPLFALNTVNFPRDTLPLSDLEQVLLGGAATAAEAGIPILGGHSIDDPEPKFGMVVVGMVHPERVLRNVGALPGDALILTKPLGVGIMTTAIKRGIASPEQVAEVVEQMARLNRAAAEVMVAAWPTVHAATDVTGFGFLGHLSEMLAGGLGVEVDAGRVPVLAAAWPFVRHGVFPGGSRRNLEAVEDRLDADSGIDDLTKLVLADAQTSGGLLIAVDPREAGELLADLHARGVRGATRVGVFTSDAAQRIRIR